MKKIISLVLALATLLCAIPLAAIGTYGGSGGLCGDNLTWSCGGGECVLTISGTGKMYDFSGKHPAPWSGYEVERVIIEEGVTSVGEYALEGQYSLENVSFPSTLKSVGAFAFFGCISLSDVAFPEGLYELGDSAFEGCQSMKHLYVPAGLSILNDDVFTATVSLESITVSPKNARFDSRNNCNAIIAKQTDALLLGCKNTVIPDGIKSIGSHSFRGCVNLASVTLPTSLRSVGDGAFKDCFGLTEAYYKGTDLEWQLVLVNNRDNELLKSCVHCASVADKKPGWHKTLYGWCYIGQDGKVVKNEWMSDSKGWCYLGSTGIMQTDTVIADSKGFCLVDSDGYWVTKAGWRLCLPEYWVYVQKNGYLLTDSWMNDSKGWCHLDFIGIMDTDRVVSDSKGFCLVDESGYWVTKEGWRLCEDGCEWVYVQKNGYLKTGGWMKDSKGWCYLNDTGYMVTDDVVKDSKGWCYVDGGGYWVTKAGWHKLHANSNYPAWVYVQKGGYLKTDSWMSDSTGWCYLGENGIMLTNAVVEDSHGLCGINSRGYWVTEEGWALLSNYNDEYDSYVYVGADGYLYRNRRVWDGSYGADCFVDYGGYRIYDDSVFIEGNWYYADDTGHIVTAAGLYESPSEIYVNDHYENPVYYVQSSDGTLLTNGIWEEPNFLASTYETEGVYVYYTAYSMDNTGKGTYYDSYFVWMTYAEYDARGYGVG